VWLGSDQAVGFEDPPDGRPRRCGSESQADVVGDGLGAGVETLVDQLPPQSDNGLLNFR
jgi:hypothetical protein